MPKWNLAEQHIYHLLYSSSKNKKIDEELLFMAYKEFVGEVITFLSGKLDYKVLIRELNIAYIEFDSLKAIIELNPHTDSKLELIICNKILMFIAKEQELMYKQMEFPKFFINIETGYKSPLHINRNLIKYVDIMEIVCGLYYLKGGVTTIDGKDVNFSDIANAFEQVFNFKFGDIYKKEIEVIKRKPENITSFLNKLRNIINQRSKDDGYQP